MNAETALIVGAALGAGGGVVGAFVGWAGVRTQARAQVEVARLQAAAQQDAEASTKRREAYAAVGSGVEGLRQHFREMERLHYSFRDNPGPVGSSAEQYAAAKSSRDEGMRAMQSAEWTLRLMLSDDEQEILTSLTNSVYGAVAELDEWGRLVLDGADPLEISRASSEYGRLNTKMHDELMTFAKNVHSLLYARPAPTPTRWQVLRQGVLRMIGRSVH
jgi:hypothetical protein